MQNEIKKTQLRLICQCGTIYPVCEMPMDVFEITKKINAASCPTCNKDSRLACIYVERADG